MTGSDTIRLATAPISILNPELYRLRDGAPYYDGMLALTRSSIDFYLDHAWMQVAMSHGRWWTIRRNGATKRWKTDPSRIRVPYKFGMYGYSAITENDFVNLR